MTQGAAWTITISERVTFPRISQADPSCKLVLREPSCSLPIVRLATAASKAALMVAAASPLRGGFAGLDPAPGHLDPGTCERDGGKEQPLQNAQGDAETERLLLLPWTDDYSGDFARVCADPEAMRFINDGRPLASDDIRSIIQRTLAMWGEYGYGPWAAVEKESGRWVGRIGVNLLGDWPGPDKWEVGFELAREHWGRGFATEGARAAIQFGWAHTPLARIISVTVTGHLASRRVMEKCGLAFQADMTFRGHKGVWYAIDRPGEH